MNTSGSALKILVIDDSNTVRQSAEMFLRQGGHEVFLAEDGFDALSKVSDHQPDMIFCDILMPRLDGYQTCAIIKRNPNFSSYNQPQIKHNQVLESVTTSVAFSQRLELNHCRTALALNYTF